jgi:hypothetical protein
MSSSRKIALGSLALFATLAACSASPDSGEAPAGATGESLVTGVCLDGYEKTCTDPGENPGGKVVCSPCEPIRVSDHTGSPDPALAGRCSLGATTLPIPPELAKKGCSLGTWYVDSWGFGGRLYACRATVATPETLSGGAPPAPGYHYAINSNTYFDSGCIGSPLGGYQVIGEDQFQDLPDGGRINQTCHGPCPIQVPPPSLGGP